MNGHGWSFTYMLVAENRSKLETDLFVSEQRYEDFMSFVV
jgi:hypothetical protein